jgi:hypothetical protein
LIEIDREPSLQISVFRFSWACSVFSGLDWKVDKDMAVTRSSKRILTPVIFTLIIIGIIGNLLGIQCRKLPLSGNYRARNPQPSTTYDSYDGTSVGPVRYIWAVIGYGKDKYGRTILYSYPIQQQSNTSGIEF